MRAAIKRLATIFKMRLKACIVDLARIGREEGRTLVEGKTATRYTLSDEWQELKSKIDWMHAPRMADYVNGLVSGKSLSEGGHWAEYARINHIQPLAVKRGRRLSMVSFACGSAHIEESLIAQFHWPISRLVGLEYDGQLRAHADITFKQKCPEIAASFYHFDYNAPLRIEEKFDIAFCCHSLHHASDVELALSSINQTLREDGVFIGIDFFGPTRFKIEYDVLPLIEELFDVLPEHFRRDLRSVAGEVTKRFVTDSIRTVRETDISESIRSSDLRTLLFSSFPVIDQKPMGGTLLRWLLQYRAGNFRHDNPDHIAIIRLLQVIERELILSRRIKSDDLFFVLGKTNRL
ncbi:MAG: SAM-dependent methyltransferase [Nitrospira sp.]|jgi:SAM-dependent methyltransferase|nr:SAM-dependent methyltransferase [Nitrospira sp.]